MESSVISAECRDGSLTGLDDPAFFLRPAITPWKQGHERNSAGKPVFPGDEDPVPVVHGVGHTHASVDDIQTHVSRDVERLPGPEPEAGPRMSDPSLPLGALPDAAAGQVLRRPARGLSGAGRAEVGTADRSGIPGPVSDGMIPDRTDTFGRLDRLPPRGDTRHRRP